VVIGFELTRPIPKPILTIRLNDAAASWDYEVNNQDAPGPRPAVNVTGPKGFKVALTSPAGDLVGSVPQRFELAEGTRDVRVTVTAPEGAVWSKRIDLKPKQETEVSVEFWSRGMATPRRSCAVVRRAAGSSCRPAPRSS
jgi:hypothetical protein